MSGSAAAPPTVEVELVFDGGSLRNPGDGYGSYQLTVGDEQPRIKRCTFGHASSNEAEYKTLIAGLEDALETLQARGKSPAAARVRVRGDSRLVLEQVRGSWKVHALHLQALRDRAAELLKRFASSELLWHARANSVRILGH